MQSDNAYQNNNSKMSLNIEIKKDVFTLFLKQFFLIDHKKVKVFCKTLFAFLSTTNPSTTYF